MRENPEQLSFWRSENQKSKINLNKVEIDDSSVIKVSFEYQNNKGIIIELVFIFKDSIKNLKYTKRVIQSPEGLRTFSSKASLEEDTCINDNDFKTMQARAIAIANDYFKKLNPKNPPDDKQLKLI